MSAVSGRLPLGHRAAADPHALSPERTTRIGRAGRAAGVYGLSEAVRSIKYCDLRHEGDVRSVDAVVAVPETPAPVSTWSHERTRYGLGMVHVAAQRTVARNGSRGASTKRTPSGEGDDAPPAGSGRRRVLITVFLLVTLAAVLVQNMPESVIKSSLMVPARPYLNLTGLDQGWSIFSPNPRQQTVYVLARLERADGSVAVRPVPAGIGASAYWNYRWQKYGETLSDPVRGRVLWRPYAAWVVDQDRLQGGDPVEVTLVRRVSDNLPPGRQPDALPFVDQDIYTAPVAR